MTDYILGQKMYLNKFKTIEILKSVFSYHMELNEKPSERWMENPHIFGNYTIYF